jgi:hypothetical protein
VDVVRIVPWGDSPLVSINADRSIVILQQTGQDITFPTGCGQFSGTTLALFDAVLISPPESLDPRNPHPLATPLAVAIEKHVPPLPPGTWIDNDYETVECCYNAEGDQEVAYGLAGSAYIAISSRGSFATAGNSSPPLFSSPDDLGGESLAVVTGPQDEFGSAEVVVTAPDRMPVFSAVHSDEHLEPGDGIADTVLLDVDPDTGVGLYGACVEYLENGAVVALQRERQLTGRE